MAALRLQAGGRERSRPRSHGYAGGSVGPYGRLSSIGRRPSGSARPALPASVGPIMWDGSAIRSPRRNISKGTPRRASGRPGNLAESGPPHLTHAAAFPCCLGGCNQTRRSTSGPSWVVASEGLASSGPRAMAGPPAALTTAPITPSLPDRTNAISAVGQPCRSGGRRAPARQGDARPACTERTVGLQRNEVCTGAWSRPLDGGMPRVHRSPSRPHAEHIGTPT